MALKDKLREDIKSKEDTKLSLEQRKSIWLENIKKINDLIRGWFSDYETENLVEFKSDQILISEEFLGTYSVNDLHLCFANGKEIIIEPKGTFIIGAWGRLDIYPRGFNSGKHYIIINRDEQGNFSQNIVNRENKREVMPFSKEIIEEIIEKWLS